MILKNNHIDPGSFYSIPFPRTQVYSSHLKQKQYNTRNAENFKPIRRTVRSLIRVQQYGEYKIPFIPKRDYLVFAMISQKGTESLSSWVNGGRDEERNFDLVLYYFEGDFPAPENCFEFAEFCLNKSGFKWPSLYHFLTTYVYKLNVEDDLEVYRPELYREFKTDYKAVFAIDDDIRMPQKEIVKFLRDFTFFGLKFAQPSYNGELSDLHFPRIQRWRGNTLVRYTNFVENAAMVIDTKVFPKIMPIMRRSISGWGIDYCFFHNAEPDVHEIGTLHTVKAIHPPNLTPSRASQAYMTLDSQTELKLNKYGGLQAPRDTVNRREGEDLMRYCGAFMYVPKVFYRIKPGEDRESVIRRELHNYEYYRSFNAIKSIW
eukprot:snap_masked-scaffold_5-processed-gene-19.28-mRNA-1 protein AED:1.00 eAED:1.00 QI:0/0/0/0/1/1/2/0/373